MFVGLVREIVTKTETAITTTRVGVQYVERVRRHRVRSGRGPG